MRDVVSMAKQLADKAIGGPNIDASPATKLLIKGKELKRRKKQAPKPLEIE